MQQVPTQELFTFLFDGLEGYLSLATIDRNKSNKFERHYFEYPTQVTQAIEFAEKNKTKLDVYFAPFLTVRKRTRKEDIVEVTCAWSDGDDCPIESLLMQPSVIIRSSKGRHAFLWRFTEVQPPEVGEEISKRIAYYHADEGMDKSGWDLTQLLRFPNTYNHKYNPPHEVSRAVIDEDVTYTPDEFSEYPEVEDSLEAEPVTEVELPDESPQELLDQYQHDMNPQAEMVWRQEPRQQDDWSKLLWSLECMCFEAGMSPEETFVVAKSAACNKYERDKRPNRDAFLWREVLRAQENVARRAVEPPEADTIWEFPLPPDILTDEERKDVQMDKTFIEEYSTWASSLGDAADVYHPVGAFTILSTLLSGRVTLPTSFGTIVPNLWFMILADTTLTRKTTAMDNATDLLLEVDYDALLATDGSVEGLMTALSTRPRRPSLFLRDEITGLMEAITKKSYMAGMMEALTKLYDGKRLKRVLRSETVDVKDPILVFFAGGIKNKMIEIIQHQHVSSGFLPRFVFVTAEADLTRLKPIGPPSFTNLKERANLLKRLKELHEHYATGQASNDGTAVHVPKKATLAELSDAAWKRYNQYEVKMLDYAMGTHDPSLMTPMMDRLAKSGLKAATLVAASRKLAEDRVKVTEQDILHAFYYIEQWQKHTAYIVSSVGTSGDEAKMQRVLSQIATNPGIARSKLMQLNYLTARDAEQIFTTLEQRNAIRRDKRGSKAEKLYPVTE